MMQAIKRGKFMVKTTRGNVSVLCFNRKSELVGEFHHKTRREALATLRSLTGTTPQLKMYEVSTMESVDTQHDLAYEVPANDE